GEWRLVRVATGETVPARIPGDTHTALVDAGKIPDPYVGTNELAVQWVGRESWAFERTFDVSADFLKEQEIFLSCDSLDTFAEVSFNGKKAGSTDNMFVRWSFDVRHLLMPGTNTIRVTFASAEKRAIAAAKKLPYPVPASTYPVQSPHRNLVRKVQCHAGWDWGPSLVVAGIYGDISLRAFSDVRIDSVVTTQRHAKAACAVKVTVSCAVVRDGDYRLSARLGDAETSRTVRLTRGTTVVEIPVTVQKPRLWWPNGYGEQSLYDLEVRLGDDVARKRIGLRTLTLVNRRDRAGLSMVFRVNGVDVFCKGANWIPADALPGRVTRERLAHLVDSAAAANMNMLRVWGGGQYESEDFYDLCDERGILLWHDMMFSCALYPATPEFLSSVEREIRWQVTRLRDHPCIALWCGNNEDVGALTWFPESRANRDRYIVDYDRLNEGVIGRVVRELDPTRTFWPSSPSAGPGDYSDNWHDDSKGDMHYWSVWHEGKPFSAFLEVTPRFCSEFGYQSFPSVATIRSYAGEEDLNVTSPVMEHHQRHPRGNSAITEMFTRYFRVPDGFESFVYLSQVQQTLAIKTAVEYWRSLRPVCMGTLFWQLDDNWPVCSWSSIEHTGAWKLLHYAARRFYAPVLLIAYVKDGRMYARIVNDTQADVRASATIRVIDFRGNVVKTDTRAVRVPAGSSTPVKDWAVTDLAASPEAGFVHLALKHGGVTSFNELFLCEPKRCALARPIITRVVKTDGDSFTVRLATDAPAFYVSLFADGVPGRFDDNCFTLLPDAPREIRFTPRAPTTLERFERGLSVMHLRATWK
ncbi:MAG TPA: glycoside hydrolase family 2 protein, partial [Spirochaetia bacterium]